MGELKSNFNTTKCPWKLLKNRQTPIKHNKTVTLGDISTLKGGWEAFTDQMLPDLKICYTHPLSTIHLASLSDARGHHPL